MIDASAYLPKDVNRATLVGRVQLPASRSLPQGGPTPVLVRNGKVFDLFAYAPTLAHLLKRDDLMQTLDCAALGLPLCSTESLISNTIGTRDPTKPVLLAPADLQPIKACGVTFACSMIERVIEEKAGGDNVRAADLRSAITATIGDDLSSIKPGSAEADELKQILIKQDAWSQYLEVGIGPYAEVFSKAQAMSSVGLGAEVGVASFSHWNNPEPELVLAVAPNGSILGATLGNDVNLRDIEGRSALLLGKAKDNNASCALGPFVRLFDEHFMLDHVRTATVSLRVEGKDGFVLDGHSAMSEISRDPADLVAQTCGAHHQYPDGFLLMTGTLFAPTQDRGERGAGFTHHSGDRVTIASPLLGTLANSVTTSEAAAPWTYGTTQLFDYLHRRLVAATTPNSAKELAR